MQLDLLDNGINSIVHGLEHYADGFKNSTNYKFAILHVGQGVELILKERLAREHWTLIFEKVERPKGKTVDFDCCVERLGTICKIDLEDYIKSLRALKNVRNEIEHYRVTISEKEAVNLIGNVVPFLIDFLDTHLKTKLQDHLDEGVWQELLTIREVADRAEAGAEAHLTHLRYEERDGGYHLVWACGLCGLEYMVELGDDGDDESPKAKCLRCNHEAVLQKCWKCGEMFPEDDVDAEGELCATCADYIRQPYT